METTFTGWIRGLQDPLWSLSTKKLPERITKVEARSPHCELSNVHQCLQTHREARIEESQPSAPQPAIPKGQEGPACCKCTQANSGFPSLLQPQPKGKYRKDCVSTVTFKNGFLVAGTACFTFLSHLHTAKLSVSAGVTQGLPHAGQGTSHPFNSLTAGALPAPVFPTAPSPHGNHRGAGRSFPGLGTNTKAGFLPLSCVRSLRASRSNSSLLIFCLNQSFRLAQYLGKSREPQNQFGGEKNRRDQRAQPINSTVSSRAWH